MALRIRRGLSANRTSITPLEGEFIYTTDTKQVYVGDGVTAGGVAVGSGSTSQYLQVANAIVTYQTKSVERAALANTNAYINTRASWSALTSTNTSLRTLINSRLQVANVVGVYQTVGTERAALANTNARINLVNENLTATNTAVRALVSDRLQVANAAAIYQTKSVERAALANTNAYIATKVNTSTFNSYVANNDTYIETKAPWTALTSTNTALRVLISDRYQVSNVNTLLNAKATWDALTSTNTSIRNYVDTKVSDLVGSAPTTLNTLNELSAALANDASFSVTVTNLIGTKISVANTKAYLANTNAFIKAQLANTNSYIATKLNVSTFNSALANTNDYIATKLNTTAFNSALANTNAYIASVATNSSDPTTRNLVFSTNTALRVLISDRLQIANADAKFATKAYAAANSYVKSVLANTNAYIETKLNTSTFNTILANTNAYIASVAASGGSGGANAIVTKTAIKDLTSNSLVVTNVVGVFVSAMNDYLQVANAVATYLTKNNPVITGTLTANGSTGTDGYYLRTSGTGIYWSPASSGSSGATWSALTTTNTALRTLISDRLQVANATTLFNNRLTVANSKTYLQVANAATLYATKISPTTSGVLAHTGRATISTNLGVSGNTTISGLIANGTLGTSNYVLKTNGTTTFWGEAAAGGGGSSSNSFSGILVGANVISADSTTDRLTLVAGSGMTIAANPTTDTITFSASGSSASFDYGASYAFKSFTF